MLGRLILAIGFVVSLCAGAWSAEPNEASQPAFSFDEAIRHGVVSWRANPEWPAGTQDEIDRIAALAPGLIYKVGIRNAWGHMGHQDIVRAASLFDALHRAMPRTLLGIGLNETVSKDYDETLQCPGQLGDIQFRAAAMTRPTAPLLGGTPWLDLALPAAREFYLCQGEIFLSIGFTLIHFEEMQNVIAHSSSPSAAWNNYINLINNLRAFAAANRRSVYFSGDPVPSGKRMPLDSVYAPSRFFHTTIPAYVKFQNKVARPGVGKGYSYTLSDKLIRTVKAEASHDVRVFFYVDNWDPRQDDLRRLMELDGSNRRYLITSSAEVAHQEGAYFIPSLNHCDGCVPLEAVGDLCEILPGTQKTEYDVFRCGDVSAVREALDLQSRDRTPR